MAQFNLTVASLLDQLGLDGRTEVSHESEVYTVSLGPIEVELSSHQEGFINFFCFLGHVPPLNADALAMLVLANRYQEEHPPISVSLLPEEQPAQLVIWSRLKLDEAHPNTLSNVFGRIADTADAMRSWLDAGAPGVEMSEDESPSSTSEGESESGSGGAI